MTGTGERAVVEVPAAQPPRLSFLSGARRVFELSIGEMLWSRRTIFMGLIVAAPVLLAVVAHVMYAQGTLRIDGAGVGAAGVFGMMIWVLYLRFIVPVLGVFYGTALIADEVEDKTITYLFTRPVSRGSVLAGKYLAYLVCTTLVVLPSVVIAYFVIVPFAEMSASFRWLVADLGILALGLAVYGALFALVGAVMRRPLLVGLVFAFGWEQVALLMPGYVRRFTVAYYLQALVPHASPSDGVTLVSLFQAVFRETPSMAVSLLSLFAILAVSLFLAMRAVEQKEYVLEQ